MIMPGITLALFALGLYGVLTRRDLVGVLASIEVMVGAALLLLVVLGSGLEASGGAGVEPTSLLLLVLVAAEAAVGLALVVAVARTSRTTRVDELTEVRG